MGGGGGGAIFFFLSQLLCRFPPLYRPAARPYRWSIKARVIDKSAVKTWNNARGSGQLFSMTLIDEQKDAIRATVFQEGVDKYFDKIQNEQVYIFSKGSVKNANKKFSTLTNDYELSLDANSDVTPAADDNTIVRQKFTIVSIANLSHKEKNSSVDLCAVVSDIGVHTQGSGGWVEQPSPGVDVNVTKHSTYIA